MRGAYELAVDDLTLRDYFAAKAPPPPEWWNRHRDGFQTLEQEATHTAQWNYEFADAMVKAKAKAES